VAAFVRVKSFILVLLGVYRVASLQVVR